MALLLGLAAPAVQAEEPAAADQQQSALPADPRSLARRAFVSVAVSAPDAPGGQSYLALALAEGRIARQHLDAALAEADDVAALKREVALALHAVDPKLGNGGGDLNYGMRPALLNAEAAMRQAGRVTGGDPRGEQLEASIAAAEKRTEESIDVGRAALVTQSPVVARQAARAMLMALDRAVNGWDREGLGRAELPQGEAGLAQAQDTAGRLAESLALR